MLVFLSCVRVAFVGMGIIIALSVSSPCLVLDLGREEERARGEVVVVRQPRLLLLGREGDLAQPPRDLGGRLRAADLAQHLVLHVGRHRVGQVRDGQVQDGQLQLDADGRAEKCRETWFRII